MTGLKYTEGLKPNEFFDELEKYDHKIDVPYEYKELLKNHICRCGKLILSSFLPDDIKKEYNKYISQKTQNTIIDHLQTDLSNTISNEIVKKLLDKN